MGKYDALFADATPAPAAPAQAPTGKYGALFEEPAPATPPDRVAPYGLTGVITGERDKPSVGDRILSGVNAVGTLATDVLDGASGGYYSKGRNAVANLISPGAGDNTAADEAAFNAAHPIAQGTASGIGYFAPTSEASMLARSAEAIGAKVAPAIAAKVAPVVSKVLTSRPVTGAATGAIVSGGQAGAEALQRGETPTEALHEAGQAAKVGAVLGAAGGTIAAGAKKLQGAAAERDVKQTLSNIIGKGKNAAIATDVKKIGKARSPIRDELATPEGRQLGDVAKKDPEAAHDLVTKKIDRVTTERTNDYNTIDSVSKGGGVRAGDLVKHLEDAAEAMEDTGHGKDAAVAAELRKAASRVKGAGNWGAKRPTPETIDPTTSFNDDYTVGQYRDLMTKAGQGAQAEADIAAKFPPKKVGTNKVFNPDTIVPTVQLRKFVTDMQSTAYDGLGGINGTNTFQKAQQVAHHGEDFLTQHLDTAAKADAKAADAVERLRAMNRRVNALSTIRQALKTRIEKQNYVELMSSPTSGLETALHVGAGIMSHGASIPASLAGMGAKAVAPGIVRGADRAITRTIADTAPGVTPPTVKVGGVPVSTKFPVGPVSVAATRPGPDQQLASLVQRADSGDQLAASKLGALTRNPIVASRVAAIRRQLSGQ